MHHKQGAIRYGLSISLRSPCRNQRQGGTSKNQLLSTLIHSCWFRNQQPALGQYWIGRVGQYSIGADTVSPSAGFRLKTALICM